jgi:CDP-diacylglycerol--glycerol-3-phosphate 3-phosphatidyltransferase
MRHIPLLLICSRLLFGLLLLLLSRMQLTYYPTLAFCLLTAGLLSDIFDGIIARRLGVSTPLLRRLDSTVDQVFFICVAIATYFQCPDFFRNHALSLGILLGTEALCYVISFLKFRKEVATHSIAAKIWTLFLFATLIQIISQCDSGWLYQVCFWTGMLSRIEIIAILLTLKSWTNDVPSLYHAWQLQKGKAIKRHKLFNG